MKMVSYYGVLLWCCTMGEEGYLVVDANTDTPIDPKLFLTLVPLFLEVTEGGGEGLRRRGGGDGNMGDINNRVK